MLAFAKLSEAATISEVEQRCQKRYFAFQIIRFFLITTFISGAAAVAWQIVTDPTQAVPLSGNLPKASNLNMSYFVLCGLKTQHTIYSIWSDYSEQLF
jgi:hypothetical protein